MSKKFIKSKVALLIFTTESEDTNMVQFEPRTEKPTAGNKYYIRKASGGYNTGIKGKPVDADCDTLANCVSYAFGRFNEESQEDGCKFLAPVNPPIMPEYSDGCEIGTEPKLGAVIIWQVGTSTSGHCGIVEAIIDENTIVTSESHYGGNAFDLNIRKRGANGTFAFKDGYAFKCFIYNPHICQNETISASEAKLLTEELAKTKNALKTAQANFESLEANIYELQDKVQNYENDVQKLTQIQLANRDTIAQNEKAIIFLNEELNRREDIEDDLKAQLKNFIRGDVNGDGKVDASDAIYLILHLIKPDKYPIN